MENRFFKGLLSKGFPPWGQETRRSSAKWYLHPLFHDGKGERDGGKSLEKQVLFHGFSKGFFGMLQASHPFFHGFHTPYYYYY